MDVITAGHTHGGIAHQVEGIAVVQPLSRGQALSRVDLVFDRNTKSVARRQLFAPRAVCARQNPITGNCVPTTEPGVPATYEHRAVTSDPAIAQAMVPALERVHRLQATTLGGSLDSRVDRVGDRGSPLGNLFADALREAVPGADVAVVNNAARGLWADLPGGPITFGRLYDVFPFDNRVVRIALSGADLGRWLAGEIREGRRGWLGLSGVEVRARCLADGLHLDLFGPAGHIRDEDRLLAVTIAAPTLSGNLASAAPPGGLAATDNAPVVREVVEDWFRRVGRLTQGELDQIVRRRSAHADTPTVDCIVP